MASSIRVLKSQTCPGAAFGCWQRAGLVLENLDGKLDPDVEAAWAEELARRIKELDPRACQPTAWESIKSRLLAE
ncbi:MAG: addiction module protein [Chromatiales bacterium]|nr:addiction module protein [Chromatiales bacterium]